MKIRRLLLLMGLALAALIAFAAVTVSADWGPQVHGASKEHHIYAYRGWQSIGVQLQEGDWYAIRAKGEWLYSPYAGPNGPEGHPRYSAPAFYPLPRAPGGALIGRVGDSGAPFYVGARASGRADQRGLLYLRIDDDLLGDNKGYVTVEVVVTRPEN